MAKFVVGLTGGIGSGKSAASDCFSRLGIEVVDADLVARQVVEPGSAGLRQISESLGRHLLTAEGQLDRPALRAQIFADPAKKRQLEAILHPLIKAEVSRQLQAANSPYAIYAAPLLIESGGHRKVDRVLVIDVPEALQLARTSQRDQQSQAQIQAIMDTQLDRDARLRHADDVIDNQGQRSELQQQVDSLHQHYLQLAAAKTLGKDSE